MSLTGHNYVDTILGRLDNLKPGNSGWTARCPCKTHGADGYDRSGDSLKIDIGQEGQVLLYCWTGCLYEDVLAALDLRKRDCRPREGEPKAQPTQILIKDEDDLDTAFCDLVFRSILQSEPIALAPSAQDFCKSQWDLDPKELKRLGYGYTLGNALAVGEFVSRHFGDDVLEVPGFRKNEAGKIIANFSPTGRILIPVRTERGHIISLKCRIPSNQEEDGKTQRYMMLGKNFAHVPLHERPAKYGTIRITEGEAKADYATKHGQYLTVSVAGVRSWEKVIPLIKRLQPDRILLAFDWADIAARKPGPLECCQKLYHALLAAGCTVGLNTWDTRYKGLDDVLRHASEEKIDTIWQQEEILELLRDHSHDRVAATKELLGTKAMPAFPLHVFPPPVRDFVSLLARKMQTVPDFTGVAALTVAARALGMTRGIQLNSTWKEHANLYTVIVAEPSSLKTPTLNMIMEPLSTVQETETRELEKWTEDYEREKQRRQGLAGKERKNLPLLKKPHGTRQLFSSNTTVEGMIACFQANYQDARHDKSFLYAPDEITSLISSMNQYKGGKGDDYDFFLKTWSGYDIAYHRKTNFEIINLKGCILSILGGVQPDRVTDLAPEMGKNDGFIARFLPSFPECPAGFKGHPDEEISDEILTPARNFWGEVIRRLLKLKPDCDTSQHTRRRFLDDGTAVADTVIYQEATAHLFHTLKIYKPYYITPTEDALEKLNCWLDDNYKRINHKKTLGAYKSWLGKARGFVTRIALVLRFIRLACLGEIAPDEHSIHIEPVDFEHAIALYDYFEQHFKKLIEHSLTPEEKQALELLHCVKEDLSGSVAIEDIHRAHKLAGIKKKSQAEKLVKLAVDRGWGWVDWKARPAIFHYGRQIEEPKS